ncbi:MAG: 50S ribosomal protein L11 methyltransferase, partial [Vicinamibacterales bacterium]
MPVGDRMSGSPSASDGSPADAIALVIAPSMGFGTGHHATTRLCLAALQTIPLEGRQVLDVGTGSGVLAIAARMLGAADVLGIDVDPDAIVSARENLELNPSVTRVGFDVADLQDHDLHGSDVVLANLTGATLVQHARTLSSQVKRGGVLIVSGLLDEERDSVLDAFGEYSLFWSQSETGWTGLALSAD